MITCNIHAYSFLIAPCFICYGLNSHLGTTVTNLCSADMNDIFREKCLAEIPSRTGPSEIFSIWMPLMAVSGLRWSHSAGTGRIKSLPHLSPGSYRSRSRASGDDVPRNAPILQEQVRHLWPSEIPGRLFPQGMSPLHDFYGKRVGTFIANAKVQQFVRVNDQE